jgi:AcrR family transcriptional regulator
MADRNVNKAARRRTTTKKRRTATETREAILAAADQRLRTGGPEALRLQQIAADAGVSHPLILHHFRSREGLIEALVERALKGFGSELVRSLATPAGTTIRDGIETVWRIVGEERYAQLFAWLALSGRTPVGRADMREFADALHAARERSDRARGRPAAPLDDTRFAMALMATALFGDALLGRVVRRRLGLPADAATDRRFRVWLANLLEHGRAGVPRRWTR